MPLLTASPPFAVIYPSCAETWFIKQKQIKKANKNLKLGLNKTQLEQYIKYKEEPYTLEQLKSVIKEVESDPLRIELANKTKAEHKIIDKKFIFNLSRIIVAIVLAVVAFIVESVTGHHGEFNLASCILYVLSAAIMLYDVVWKVIQNIIHLRNPLDMNLLLTISCLGVFVLSLLIQFDVLKTILNSNSMNTDIHTLEYILFL